MDSTTLKQRHLDPSILTRPTASKATREMFAGRIGCPTPSVPAGCRLHIKQRFSTFPPPQGPKPARRAPAASVNRAAALCRAPPPPCAWLRVLVHGRPVWRAGPRVRECRAQGLRFGSAFSRTTALSDSMQADLAAMGTRPRRAPGPTSQSIAGPMDFRPRLRRLQRCAQLDPRAGHCPSRSR